MDKLSIFLLLLFFGLALARHHRRHNVSNEDQGLRVNCKENRFDLDGVPFRYIAGGLNFLSNSIII